MYLYLIDALHFACCNNNMAAKMILQPSWSCKLRTAIAKLVGSFLPSLSLSFSLSRFPISQQHLQHFAAFASCVSFFHVFPFFGYKFFN